MVDFAIPTAATIGPDRTRTRDPSDSRYWIVSTLWLQQALNAQRRASGRTDFLVEDSTSGPATLAAALAQAPVGTPAPAIYSRTQMAIANSFADILARGPLPPRQGVRIEAGEVVLDPPYIPNPEPVVSPPPAPSSVASTTSYVTPVVVGASALALLWWATK